MDETLFYLCGALLIISAAVVALIALKSDRFPGRAMPLLIGWFLVLGVAACTFALLEGTDDSTSPQPQEYAVNGEVESAASEAKQEGREEESEETGEGGPEFEEQVSGAAEGLEGELPSSGNEGGEASLGTVVFSENCSTCHGATGHGGNGGPDLRTMPLAQTEEGAIEQVTNGGGGMPAFKGVLSEEEIENVAAYVAQEITMGE
jgi:mono/diheme cytochrome c family protein